MINWHANSIFWAIKEEKRRLPSHGKFLIPCLEIVAKKGSVELASFTAVSFSLSWVWKKFHRNSPWECFDKMFASAKPKAAAATCMMNQNRLKILLVGFQLLNNTNSEVVILNYQQPLTAKRVKEIRVAATFLPCVQSSLMAMRTNHKNEEKKWSRKLARAQYFISRLYIMGNMHRYVV